MTHKPRPGSVDALHDDLEDDLARDDHKLLHGSEQNSTDYAFAGWQSKVATLSFRRAIKTSHLQILIVTTIALVLGIFLALGPYARSRTVTDLRRYGTVVQIGNHWPVYDKLVDYFPFGDSYTTNDPGPRFDLASPSKPLPLHIRQRVSAAQGSILLHANVTHYPVYLSEHFNHSKIRVHNMAVPGTPIDNDVTTTMNFFDFPHNVERFENSYCDDYAGSCKPLAWSSDDSLFSVFYGINDLTYKAFSPAAVKATFQTYDRALDTLYTDGARNFMLMNIPPIDLAPPFANTERYLEDHHVQRFNEQIELSTQRLKRLYPDVTIFSIDLNSLIRQAIRNPQRFAATKGILDTTTYCPTYFNLYWAGSTVATAEQVASCGGLLPTEYLWHDNLHLESTSHMLIADAVYQLLMSI